MTMVCSIGEEAESCSELAECSGVAAECSGVAAKCSGVAAELSGVVLVSNKYHIELHHEDEIQYSFSYSYTVHCLCLQPAGLMTLASSTEAAECCVEAVEHCGGEYLTT